MARRFVFWGDPVGSGSGGARGSNRRQFLRMAERLHLRRHTVNFSDSLLQLLPFFAQYQWRVTPKLTVNDGLRYALKRAIQQVTRTIAACNRGWDSLLAEQQDGDPRGLRAFLLSLQSTSSFFITSRSGRHASLANNCREFSTGRTRRRGCSSAHAEVLPNSASRTSRRTAAATSSAAACTHRNIFMGACTRRLRRGREWWITKARFIIGAGQSGN